jgi:site-specific recombinase XerD
MQQTHSSEDSTAEKTQPNPETVEGNQTNLGVSKDQLREILRSELKDDLDPLSPAEALQKYLETKESEYASTTLKSHESRLRQFIAWCGKQGIDNLNELGGTDLNDYRNWRRDDGDLNPVSEKTQQDTLRVFIRFCEALDAVKSGLSDKVISPSLGEDDGARDIMLSHDRAKETLSYLEKYEYASLEHVVWVILAQTGIRTGGLRALDVEDYYPEAEDPYLAVRHSPDKGTGLKNETDGERYISISEAACNVLDDYLNDQRPDVTDEFGREPLIATSHGRIGRATIRKYAYKWTRPCVIGNGCPHGREPETCEAAAGADSASKCDSSRSPHPVRRGYITHELKTGVPMHVVSERCNVSEDVIEEHYDERDEEQRMRQRRQLFDSVYEDADRYGVEEVMN